MRLSDAILMGRHLVTPMAGSYCEQTANGGCALTMGMKAVGAVRRGFSFGLWQDAHQVWPWLNRNCDCKEHGSLKLHIATMFDGRVMTGEMTLEQFVDYVRSIEPAEEPEPIPEPSADDGYYDDEPLWNDTATRLEQMNSIKGR